MKSTLFNTEITKNSFLGMTTKLTKEQEAEILAGLFEQLLLFDRVVLSTDKTNQTERKHCFDCDLTTSTQGNSFYTRYGAVKHKSRHTNR